MPGIMDTKVIFSLEMFPGQGQFSSYSIYGKKGKQDVGPARDRPVENYSPSPFGSGRSRVSAAS